MTVVYSTLLLRDERKARERRALAARCSRDILLSQKSRVGCFQNFQASRAKSVNGLMGFNKSRF